jgi:hypothetical protein
MLELSDIKDQRNEPSYRLQIQNQCQLRVNDENRKGKGHCPAFSPILVATGVAACRTMASSACTKAHV